MPRRLVLGSGRPLDGGACVSLRRRRGCGGPCQRTSSCRRRRRSFDRRPARAERRPLPAWRGTDVDRHRIEADPFIGELGVRDDWGKKRRQGAWEASRRVPLIPCRLRLLRAKPSSSAAASAAALRCRHTSARMLRAAPEPEGSDSSEPLAPAAWRSRGRTGPPPPGCAILADGAPEHDDDQTSPGVVGARHHIEARRTGEARLHPVGAGIAAKQTIVIGYVLPPS